MENKIENQNIEAIEQKTKAKLSKGKVIPVVIGLLVTIPWTCARACVLIKENEKEKNEHYSRVIASQTEYNEDTRSYSFSEQSIEFKKPNETETIVPGESIIFYNKQKDIKYCEILDEYYTENGENIALCEKTETIPATAQVIDSNIIYTVPNGYTLKDGKGYRTAIYYVVEEDGKYELPVGCTLEDIVEIIETKPYSELIGYDLVIKSGEEYTINKAGTKEYKTEYVLQKRN